MSERREGSDRFAALAMEMVGAELTRGMIDRVWEHASPEVKTELSNAVMASVTSKLEYAQKSGGILYHPGEAVAKIAMNIIEENREEITARVRERVLENIDVLVDEAVARAREDLHKRIIEKISRVVY